MAAVTAAMVKELRESTGAGMMECKKALTETDGDMEAAVDVLRKSGAAKVEKKAGRIAAEGITRVASEGNTAVVVEFNSETDFVAKNATFQEFVQAVADKALKASVDKAGDGEDVCAILDMQSELEEKTLTIGEKLSIRRFQKITGDCVASYIHGGGRIGVMVEVACDTESEILEEVAREVCMQVAAANPLFLSKEEVDSESLEKEKEIYRVQALNEGKPENIVEKMVNGRIQKYYKEVCLLDQAWVKDGDKSITKYLQEKSKEVGSPITVTRYARFERGEGIEKVEEDFAAEVAKTMGLQ